MSGEEKPKREPDLVVGRSSAFLQGALSHEAGRFYKLGVVQEHEGLQRCAGDLPSHGAVVSFRGIEGHHRRRRGCAFPVGIEAASIQSFARVRLVFPAGGFFLPEPFRLVGFHAWSADLVDEESGRGEGVVTNQLGGETMARSAGEKFVVRIAGQRLGRRLGRLAIGRGEQDEFVQFLQIPTGLDEGAGEPVEQFRVRGQGALAAKVLGGGHEAVAEMQLPVSIHNDPGRQRLFRIRDPFGETEPVAGQLGIERENGVRRAGLDLIAVLIIGAALEQISGTRLRQVAHRHDFIDAIDEPVFVVAKFLQFRSQLDRRLIHVCEIIFQQIFLAGLRRLHGRIAIDRLELKRSQALIEHLQVSDEAILETASSKSRTKGQWSTIGEILEQGIADDLDRERFSVQVQLHADCAAGAVAGDAELEPFVEFKFLAGANLERVAGPEMNESKRGVTIFENELVALIPRVRAGLLMVQHHDLVLFLRDIQPESEGEWIGAFEVGHFVDRNRILTTEEQGRTHFAFHLCWRFSQPAGVVRAHAVPDGLVCDRIEGVATDESAVVGQLRPRFQPHDKVRSG